MEKEKQKRLFEEEVIPQDILDGIDLENFVVDTERLKSNKRRRIKF